MQMSTLLVSSDAEAIDACAGGLLHCNAVSSSSMIGRLVLPIALVSQEDVS